jgi:hypothetical protein
MLDMFTRGLLERKYANMEAETRNQQQQVTNAGLVAAAQANSLNVSAGLAPRLANSEIDERDVQTQGLRLGLPFIQKRAQSDLDLNTANIGLTNARTQGEIAGVGLTRANTATVNDQRRRLPITGADFVSSLRQRLGLGALF